MITFPAEWKDLDVALAHDWLTGMRGGERVLELLCQAFPNATIYTLLHDPATVSKTINSHKIETSFLQSVPGIARNYRRFLPLFPAAINSLTIPDVDLLISTSHAAVKSIRTSGHTRHLCYCFTPMRYAWLFYREYFGNNPLKAAILKPLLASLRSWDKRTACRVDRFVGISEHIQTRIKTFYGRDADLVYPHVDIDRFTPGPDVSGGFDLVLSALAPYKRADLAVRAYNKLGYPLKVVGTGSQYDQLTRLAAPNVELLGWQTDDQILELYRSCRMLIFPGEEDFGIVPLEAQACGKPVVAYGRGGALETVARNISGVFFDSQDEASLLDAIKDCSSRKWNTSEIRTQATKFGPGAFIQGLARSIDRCMAGQ